jgi:DnaD/phage-associated family protein
MPNFEGFTGKSKLNIQIPEDFFTRVLPELDDPDELKGILFVFWYLQAREENTGYATCAELIAEPLVAAAFGVDIQEREKKFSKAIEKAVKHGVFLYACQDDEDYIFINSSRGKALLQGLKTGDWQAQVTGLPTVSLADERPNIFTLYEQNIGLLTPIIADTLVDAEKTYPAGWIEEAMKIAVERNARNWRFIEAILRSWKEKGRDENDQRPAAESRKRDSEGEFGEFVRH